MIPCIYLIKVFSIEIVSFNKSAVAVPLHANMTFNCEANGDEAYLKMDDNILFLIKDHHGVYPQSPIQRNDTGLWVLSVTIQANSTNNKTKITCFVDSTENDRYLIIAGMYNYISHTDMKTP